jgi:hypothetical protein
MAARPLTATTLGSLRPQEHYRDWSIFKNLRFHGSMDRNWMQLPVLMTLAACRSGSRLWRKKRLNYPIKKPIRKQFNKPFVPETEFFFISPPVETHADRSSHFNGFMDTVFFYGYLFLPWIPFSADFTSTRTVALIWMYLSISDE